MVYVRQVGDRPLGASTAGGARRRSVWRGATRALAGPHRHRRQDDEGRHHVRGRLHRGSQGHDVSDYRYICQSGKYLRGLLLKILKKSGGERRYNRADGNATSAFAHYAIPINLLIYICASPV